MIQYENLGKANGPFFGDLAEAFHATLRGGWYILGNRLRRFEQEFDSTQRYASLFKLSEAAQRRSRHSGAARRILAD